MTEMTVTEATLTTPVANPRRTVLQPPVVVPAEAVLAGGLVMAGATDADACVDGVCAVPTA
ncbi:hypothetical protein GIS00_12480 [Nakamurella sp. YIM 132087]|uniref:Uncharacterized protein n=1 Tax=Nakamurella alba TaxID=2665158 RepID=A0A7K1FKY3_9ACTN|nr:hypothetical protein [Nakamurella alba]MTD14756.1 hypothetical protein [Nakamurella alba]